MEDELKQKMTSYMETVLSRKTTYIRAQHTLKTKSERYPSYFNMELLVFLQSNLMCVCVMCHVHGFVYPHNKHLAPQLQLNIRSCISLPRIYTKSLRSISKQGPCLK
jgi:hypothetical protein